MQADEDRTGWLSPTGQFVACAAYGHYGKAREICEAIYQEALYQDQPLRADEYLHAFNWASIHIVSAFFEHGFLIAYKRDLTPEQIRFLKPYYNGDYGLEMVGPSKSDYEYQLYQMDTGQEGPT